METKHAGTVMLSTRTVAYLTGSRSVLVCNVSSSCCPVPDNDQGKNSSCGVGFGPYHVFAYTMRLRKLHRGMKAGHHHPLLAEKGGVCCNKKATAASATLVTHRTMVGRPARQTLCAPQKPARTAVRRSANRFMTTCTPLFALCR